MYLRRLIQTFFYWNFLSFKLHVECGSQCSDDGSPIDIPPITLAPLLPVAMTSPEKRIVQKEIVAGEERPKFMGIKQTPDSLGECF